ncbi:hypothetical protein [Natronorubrum bangense]|uniref:Uncharacterized protein n=2 Tax=Natronorubrum bangense TaxID=61858 RepID=L9WKA0_9EURY|nr:hypothetical protein [Natronorubrum bangense]ELY49879.1 hypothetical protein C494_07710 [Natronorubrum bangense JCM 10635]QCC55498.1 hypothetical protein DV706_14085 [Natronorubrum bangense]
MAQIYDRWYILPIAETDVDGSTERSPELFGQEDEIVGWAGNIVDMTPVTAYPTFDGEYYIARVYGSWAAVNHMSVQHDQLTLSTSDGEIDVILSQRFPEIDVGEIPWEERFKVEV